MLTRNDDFRSENKAGEKGNQARQAGQKLLKKSQIKRAHPGPNQSKKKKESQGKREKNQENADGEKGVWGASSENERCAERRSKKSSRSGRAFFGLVHDHTSSSRDKDATKKSEGK